jgi:hypothetical protein
LEKIRLRVFIDNCNIQLGIDVVFALRVALKCRDFAVEKKDSDFSAHVYRLFS